MASASRAFLRGRTAARLTFCLALAALGCDDAPKDAGAPAAGSSQPAVTIGDRTLTVGEVDAHVKENLFRQATEEGDPAKLYELRSNAIDQMVDETLLDAEAKRRNIDRDGLLAAEATKAKPVEESEVKALYDRFKDRLGETEYEQVAGQIRTRLGEQRKQEARTAFVAGLRAKGDVAVLLEPPRIEVAADGPSRGPESAPVTIVEFSDYQCPFCKRAEATLRDVLKRYPEQVRLVYRHFPIDGHKDARPAAEAAACAGEQGKFWEFHDQVFQSSPALDAGKLRQLGEQVKLDTNAFDACITEGRHRAKVQADADAGREAGVSGTPAFFVNGIPLSGARSIAEFEKLIDAELARAKPPGA